MSLVVLDTDVASTILRGRDIARLQARLAGKTWCISSITLGELTAWTILRSWGPRRIADFDDWRSGVVLLPIDDLVATTWGQIRARAQLRGHPHPVNDSWIAACALANGLPLATFNTKDYLDFVHHEDLVLLDVA